MADFFIASWAGFFAARGALLFLAFPCFVFGLLVLPLCGAALTFFAAAKKVSKESGLTPLACRCLSLSALLSGPRRVVPSHFLRS
ncbi:hypothetical protein D0B32_15125 [Paraburkholderia sp. DHOC27]|nr:hypothetical protein D0B32_15125 [Paraburkholderia sp. DHOC27]